jgi:hypothetical protein
MHSCEALLNYGAVARVVSATDPPKTLHSLGSWHSDSKSSH